MVLIATFYEDGKKNSPHQLNVLCLYYVMMDTICPFVPIVVTENLIIMLVNPSHGWSLFTFMHCHDILRIIYQHPGNFVSVSHIFVWHLLIMAWFGNFRSDRTLENCTVCVGWNIYYMEREIATSQQTIQNNLKQLLLGWYYNQ